MVTEDFQVCPLLEYWGCSPCVFSRACFSKKTLCAGGSLCNRWRYQSSEHRVSNDFPVGRFLLLGRVSIIPGKFPPLLLFSLCLRTEVLQVQYATVSQLLRPTVISTYQSSAFPGENLTNTRLWPSIHCQGKGVSFTLVIFKMVKHSLIDSYS